MTVQEESEATVTAGGVEAGEVEMQVAGGGEQEYARVNTSRRASVKLSNVDALEHVYAKDARLLPKRKLALTFGIWVLVFVFSLLRGGKGGASAVGAECGDGLYWGLLAGNLVMLVVATGFLRSKLLKTSTLRASLGHALGKGELVWDDSTTVKYPSISIAAGIGAGLLGIGGGMIVGPLLLALGSMPQSSAATSAWVVLITASSGLAQVLIYGILPFDYALLFGGVGLCSTVVGLKVVGYLIKKYVRARPSARPSAPPKPTPKPIFTPSAAI